MDCDDVYALLDAYVDRELDVAHDLAIATHLQTCQGCAQRYEALLLCCRLLYAPEARTLRLRPLCVNACGPPCAVRRRPLS